MRRAIRSTTPELRKARLIIRTAATVMTAAWPKPAQCQARRAHVCRFSPHFCLLLAQGNSPRTSLVSERHRIEFRQVWKVASSSLASFFYCNMWGDLRAEKLLQDLKAVHAVTKLDVEQYDVHVGEIHLQDVLASHGVAAVEPLRQDEACRLEEFDLIINDEKAVFSSHTTLFARLR